MRKSLSVFIIIVLIIILNTNPVSYVMSMAADQIVLLARSNDIQKVISDNTVEQGIRNQLALVSDVMRFGDQLGFPQTTAYSTYIPLKREIFLHSLSATKKDSFEEYRWYWPFIGSLPYKGFINETDARAEQSKLRAQGFDTYIGKSGAMSTLGIFPDPILRTMLNTTDATVLISIIYHERTHQLFFTNDVVFNENAAVLLGSIAALEFVKQKFGNQSTEYNIQQEKIQDMLLFSSFISNVYDELNALYTSDDENKVEKREAIFFKHLDIFNKLKPQLKRSFKAFGKVELNNAYILAQYRYYGKIRQYYDVYTRFNNTQKTIDFFDEASRAESPTSFIGKI